MKELNEPIFEVTPEVTERRAFESAEMIACPACSRTNAPTREKCLYCGDALPLTGKNVREVTATAPVQAEPESIHVVVFTPRQIARDEAAIAEAARLLHLSKSEVTALRKAKTAAPLRVVTLSDAHSICECLRRLGFPAVSVTDARLHPEIASRDIRALKLDDDSLTGICRHRGERVSVMWEDVTLIVAGRLHTTTVEVEQKRNRKQNRVLNERELSSDEAVLDIYTHDDPAGWRIKSGSFDFSCLGEDKALTTFENFAALVALLERSAAYAHFDDSYGGLRSALKQVWPIEQREGATELRRSARGRIEAKISSRDNEDQFTRYSRLLWLVETGRAEDNE